MKIELNQDINYDSIVSPTKIKLVEIPKKLTHKILTEFKDHINKCKHSKKVIHKDDKTNYVVFESKTNWNR